MAADPHSGLAAGTLVRTPFGEIAVEALQVGDFVLSHSGDLHRVTSNRVVAPSGDRDAVRIVAGAFGGGAPSRDLVVRANQPVMVVCVDECLIPIQEFLNKATVARIGGEGLAFRQIELDRPDVIVADGLPVASSIALAAAHHSDGDSDGDGHGDSRGHFMCDDPLIIGALRMRLTAHARSLSWTPTKGDPELALDVDGRTLRPGVAGEMARFVIDAPPSEMWIVSRSFVPRDCAMSADTRRLGVMIKTVQFDDGLDARTIAFDDPRLTQGFHGPESEFRWTDGRARLPGELWQNIGSPFFLKLTYDTLLPGPFAAPAGAVT